jgi:hypothetical protein
MNTGKRSTRRLGSAAVVCAILMASATTTQAAVLTSITYSPNPITLGNQVQYTANDDGTWPIGSYKWEYRCLGPSGPSNWIVAFPTTNIYTSVESRPGDFEVKCTATYKQLSPQSPPPPSSVQISITIPAANADAVISGLNTPTNCGSQSDNIAASALPLTFEVRVGRTAVGAYLSGTLEERIRRPQLDPPYDSGWQPGNQDLFIRNGQVIDNKTYTIAPPDNLASYNTLSNGYVLDDFFQQFRITTTATAGCGNQVVMYLTEHHFKRYKSGAGQWSLFEP